MGDSSRTPRIRTTRTLSQRAAREALDAAVERASELGVPVCVAVSDRAGHLLAYVRMDGAPLLSETLSQDKAWTSCAFGRPTHEWYDLIKAEPALLHGIVKTDRLVVFGGGVPVHVDGELVGAVGVSGASTAQDREIAEAGAGAVTGPDGRT